MTLPLYCEFELWNHCKIWVMREKGGLGKFFRQHGLMDMRQNK